MGDQIFNFATRFPENWGFSAPNFAILGVNFLTRRFSDNFPTDKNVGGNCPPPLPRRYSQLLFINLFIFHAVLQLMMHDYDDVPKMGEKGTSVSPGLRSFISLETTQVGLDFASLCRRRRRR